MDEKLEKALEELCSAVVDPGVNKEYHSNQIARLRMEWPSLHNALIRVISAYKPVDLKKG